MNTILNLIPIAGDCVREEVWYCMLQVVTSCDDAQGYTAKTIFEVLWAPDCHENMVNVSGYILGEFENLIAGDPHSSPLVQFLLLHSKFYLYSVVMRTLMLSTYIKFINLFLHTKATIQVMLWVVSQLCNTMYCCSNVLSRTSSSAWWPARISWPQCWRRCCPSLSVNYPSWTN